MKYEAKYRVVFCGFNYRVFPIDPAIYKIEIAYDGDYKMYLGFLFNNQKNAEAFAKKMNGARWTCLNNMEQPGGIIIDKAGNIHEPVEMQQTDDPARDFLADLCEACSLHGRKECAFAKCREKVRSNGDFYYAKRKKQK